MSLLCKSRGRFALYLLTQKYSQGQVTSSQNYPADLGKHQSNRRNYLTLEKQNIV